MESFRDDELLIRKNSFKIFINIELLDSDFYLNHACGSTNNTFGAAYDKFMGSRNFSPYDPTRARTEVHDLFGLPTNLIGESSLNVEFEQMYLPMCMLSVIGGTVRFNEKQRSMFLKHYFPWALRAGRQCTDLMSVYYERHFSEDLEQVRRKWGIIPAPQHLK
ncbi:hypothetical protein CARUB_v10018152mg [Capsella rubella]|uniref:Uncharacterized protein n=1 Tax=Capsella rubella TaxID=81985 RepID=R0FQM5_9BRAS|nr:hypothetical protein CARUB_v10018152mg [Capsella rubella]